jgi:hypothetical protein
MSKQIGQNFYTEAVATEESVVKEVSDFLASGSSDISASVDLRFTDLGGNSVDLSVKGNRPTSKIEP